MSSHFHPPSPMLSPSDTLPACLAGAESDPHPVPLLLPVCIPWHSCRPCCSPCRPWGCSSRWLHRPVGYGQLTGQSTEPEAHIHQAAAGLRLRGWWSHGHQREGWDGRSCRAEGLCSRSGQTARSACNYGAMVFSRIQT